MDPAANEPTLPEPSRRPMSPTERELALEFEIATRQDAGCTLLRRFGPVAIFVEPRSVAFVELFVDEFGAPQYS